MHSSSKATLVRNAIQNPKDGRHFMRIKPRTRLLTAITPDGTELARSKQVYMLLEAGMDLYDPTYYFPRADVRTDLLEKTDKSTHCPLKGDTAYYHIVLGDRKLENAAWSYVKPFDFSMDLKDRIAFDPEMVQLVEHLQSD